MSASPRPARFTFGTDFGSSRSESKRLEELEARIAALEAEVVAAEDRGYAAGRAVGYASGKDDAAALAAARTADAVERIAAGVRRLLDAQGEARDGIEREALDVALASARLYAEHALRLNPLGPVEALFRDCLAFVRGAPHLALRVAPDMVEAVREAVKTIAYEGGFEGRIVVLGEPEFAPGAVRIEWADGGAERDPASVEAAVRRAVSDHFASTRTGGTRP